MKTPITQERLKQLLHYAPDTGAWVWRLKHHHKRCGDAAGCSRSDGYLVIGIDGRQYLAHRLAWLYMTGEWPVAEVDHLDGSPANCKWENLRDATRTKNSQNQRRAKTGRADGSLLGVSFDSRRGVWRARIVIHKVEKWLGYFATAEEAHAAYVAAKRSHHDGCTI